MEDIQKVIGFVKKIVSDDRLKPVHISLSVALFDAWSSQNFTPSYKISRRLLMQSSRIRSFATYHKAIKELQQFGYIQYIPTYHPHHASQVTILP